MHCRTLFVAMAVGASHLTPTSALGEASVERQVVGPYFDYIGPYNFSPRGVRQATAIARGEGGVMIVDGEEGPLFDSLFNTPTILVSLDPDLIGQTLLSETARKLNDQIDKNVAFSPDGSRYAYACLIGNDCVVIADGKEHYRAPFDNSPIAGLQFSPGGKHLYFMRMQTPVGEDLGFQVVMDGKPEAPSYMQPYPVFSPDDDHYAYVATRAGTRDDHYLVIDGKAAPYVGHRPAFDATNRVISVRTDPETTRQTLLVDGEPVLTAHAFGDITPAPVGGRFAVAANMGPEGRRLFVDGEPVATANNIDSVLWSPDGQRYAALCTSDHHTKYVVLDGENGPEYGNITDIKFSPDSTRLVYIGFAGGMNHVVFDNSMQTDGHPAIAVKPYFYGPDSHVATVLTQSIVDMTLLVGDQMIGGLRQITGLTISPDGSRFAFTFGAQGSASSVIDGQQDLTFGPSPFASAVPESKQPTQHYVFSPDSRHVAYVGTYTQNPRYFGVVIDGALIQTTSTLISRPHFTPDSRHIFWCVPQNPYIKVFLDGEPVAQVERTSSSNWERDPRTWEMGDDGVFTLLGVQDGQVVRLRITPGDDTSIKTMIAKAAGE